MAAKGGSFSASARARFWCSPGAISISDGTPGSSRTGRRRRSRKCRLRRRIGARIAETPTASSPLICRKKLPVSLDVAESRRGQSADLLPRVHPHKSFINNHLYAGQFGKRLELLDADSGESGAS